MKEGNRLPVRNIHAFALCTIVTLIIITGLVGVVSGHTVNLISPENSAITNLNNNSLQFIYNHTGSLTGIVNCTLYIDGNPVNYSTDVPANTSQIVYSNLSWSEGTHYWYVNCTNGTSQESSLDIGQNYTFTADFTPPNITSWYTNATNASSPQDLMFLVGVNDSVFFNITVNESNLDSFVWLVNKADQSNNASNFTFIIPDCDHTYNPSSCIWEIHVIVNDSAGNEDHHEWVISTLSINEAPDMFDYFTDGSITNRTETDPWGRFLKNWTIESGTPYLNRNCLYASENTGGTATLTLPSTAKYGTWKYKIYFPMTGNSGLYTRLEFYPYGDYPRMLMQEEGDAHDRFKFEKNASAWAYLSHDSGWYLKNKWVNITIVHTKDSIWYYYFDDVLAYRSYAPSEPNSVTNLRLHIQTNNNPPYDKVYFDGLEVYKGKYLFPSQRIEYKEYVTNIAYKWSGYYYINKTGIVVDKRNTTLKEISETINNASLITYDDVTRTAHLYTNLVVGYAGELIIDNETLIIHCNSNAEYEFGTLWGATLMITNSTITSANNNYYIWRMSGATHFGFPASFLMSKYINENRLSYTNYGTVEIRNSTINNTAYIYFDSPHELVIENSRFTNLHHDYDISNNEYRADSDYPETYRRDQQGNKSFWLYLDTHLNFELKKFTFRNVTFTGADQNMNLTVIISDEAGDLNLYDVDINGKIYTKKVRAVHSQWETNINDWRPTRFGCVNCKFTDLDISTDMAQIDVKYYLDVKIVDSSGNPIPGAVVSVTNEIDNTNYPCENITNAIVGETYFSYINYLSHTTATTGADGHTPLPTFPSSNSLVIADYVKNQTEQINFTYTITANKTADYGYVILKNTLNTIYPNGTVYYAENKTFSGIVTGVDPNESWYIANPLNPTYTVNITITTGDEVNMSVNSSAIMNLTMNEYSPKLINFTATNTTTDQKMNITVYNGTFIVVNGKKYEIKKDGVVQQTKTASDNKVVFTDIPVGSDYVITEESGGKEHKLPVARPVCATGIAILIVIAYWRYRRRRSRMRSGGLIVLVPGITIDWLPFIYN